MLTYLFMSLLPNSSKKKQQLGIKIFLQQLIISRDGPVKSTERRKGWKHKKTILLQKSRGEEKPEAYSTSVACPYMQQM